MDSNFVAVATQVVSAVAVVISLLYLERQMKQSTATARAAACQWFAEQQTELMTVIFADERLTELFHRAVTKRESLETFSEIEKSSLTMLWVLQARVYETKHRQVNEGVLEQSALHLIANMTFLSSPVWHGAWPRVSEALSADFVAYFNSRHNPTLTAASSAA